MANSAALIALFILAISQSWASQERSQKQRAAFVREHPCPATGHTYGRCPGHVVDHVIPLCAGGPDRPSNMQWQNIEEGKLKDKDERAQCRQ